MKYLDAIMCFEKALEIDPKDVIALSNKANALDMLGRSHEALNFYEQALAIDSTGDSAVEPLYNKGVVLMGLQRWPEALQCFEQTLQINPTRADAWCNKGVILSRFDKNEEAIECLDIALQYDPKADVAWVNKASILFEWHRFEEAINCCDIVLQLNIQSANAWTIKSEALFGLGLFNESITCVDQWIEIDIKNPEAWYRKGTVYFSLGELNEAQVCLNKVISLNPTYPEAQKLARLVQKRSIVQQLVELGKQDTFQIPNEVFDQLDDEFFAILGMEVNKLRFEGRHKEANWLENDLQSTLATMSLLGIRKRSKPTNEEEVRRAFDAFFKESISLDDSALRRAVAKVPYMTNPDFINLLERTIEQQAHPDLKSLFEQHVKWLRQIANERKQIAQPKRAVPEQQSEHQSIQLETGNQAQIAFDALQRASSFDEVQKLVIQFPLMLDPNFIDAVEEIVAKQVPLPHKASYGQRLTWLRQVASIQHHLPPSTKPTSLPQSNKSHISEPEQQNPLQPAVDAFQCTNSLNDMRQAVGKFPIMKSKLFIASIEQLIQQIPPQLESAQALSKNRLAWLRQIANEQENSEHKPQQKTGLFSRIFKKRD